MEDLQELDERVSSIEDCFSDLLGVLFSHFNELGDKDVMDDLARIKKEFIQINGKQ
jgi:hypothetical protein